VGAVADEAALGPILLAALRGELRDLWQYTELPAETEEGGKAEKKPLLDETIEAGSEVAQRARAAARAEKIAEGDDGVDDVADAGTGTSTPGEAEEDDSWMDGGVASGTNASGASARKRKGKKK
jgi:minor histocompatibility antigen H13